MKNNPISGFGFRIFVEKGITGNTLNGLFETVLFRKFFVLLYFPSKDEYERVAIVIDQTE